jgi:POT family proton-dependent oligopeptide transporter
MAGTLGGMIDEITAEYSLSSFFLIFTVLCVVLGLISILLNRPLKRMMHGIR